MARTRLLLVFGGRSSEHEISLRSAAEVLAAIDRQRFEVLLLGIARDGSFHSGTGTPQAVLQSGRIVVDIASLQPDVVFPLLHGPYGEDGTFQGMLEVLGLPYVGSGVLASALCMDKAVQKHFLAQAAPELPLLPWLELDAAEREGNLARISETLGFPCFVKPANMGSSVGVSKVTRRDELVSALSRAAKFDDKIVVEKGIVAREIELAVLGNGGPETIVSAPGEIVLPPGSWYDYETKYLTDTAKPTIPAELPQGLATRLQELALLAFRKTGCRGLCRIDFLLDKDTMQPWLNELNTIPGFTSISMYPKMMEHSGIAYGDLVTRLCELAIEHQRKRSRLSCEAELAG